MENPHPYLPACWDLLTLAQPVCAGVRSLRALLLLPPGLPGSYLPFGSCSPRSPSLQARVLDLPPPPPARTHGKAQE